MPFSFRSAVSALVACACIAGPTYTSHAAAPAAPSAMQMRTLLSSTFGAPRNMLAIGSRLKLHVAPVVSAQAGSALTDLPVGYHTHLWDTVGTAEVELGATLVFKTAHSYFYLQDGQQVDMQKLAAAANLFEHSIMPRDNAAFGMQSLPGPDHDDHVTVLMAKMGSSGILGQVYAEDLLPISIFPYSNQRQIMYLNLDTLQVGTSEFTSVLAHEFQHVIHEHLHPTDDVWINEGSSVLAQVLNGYPADYALQSDQQLDCAEHSTCEGGVYGNGFTWLQYLYEQYGGDRVTRAILADSKYSGIALFDDVLRKLGVKKTANQVFEDWMVANLLNNKAIDGGIYGYTKLQPQVTQQASEPLPFTYSGQSEQYAATYLTIPQTGSKAFTLNFQGAPTVPLLKTTAIPPGGFLWSIRGDGVDDTLTSPVLDLSRVTHATLRYQLFYDLEQDYDYGYVEVSTDGGKTWYAQRTSRMTSTNPNGTNMGIGYTGASCTGPVTGQSCWVNEQIDLSPYAGKHVLIRFEQVTDDEFNGEGLALAHVQVPEIGFDGDAASAGWTMSGWIHAGNTIAEPWSLQAVLYRPSGISVVSAPVDASGHGTLAIPAGVTKAVAVVSPLAPVTTLTSTFTLSGS